MFYCRFNSTPVGNILDGQNLGKLLIITNKTIISVVKRFFCGNKMAPIGTRIEIVSLESGALPACLFPAGTLITYSYMYVVQCAHIYLCIALTL